jgi:hypothetical protein
MHVTCLILFNEVHVIVLSSYDFPKAALFHCLMLMLMSMSDVPYLPTYLSDGK